ncbi:hypothetical protein RB213_006466 [Colletotrichum asianum]
MMQLRAERQNTLRGFGDERWFKIAIGHQLAGAEKRTHAQLGKAANEPLVSLLNTITSNVLALQCNSHLKPAAARRGLGAVTMDSAPGRTASTVGVDRGGLDWLGAPGTSQQWSA